MFGIKLILIGCDIVLFQVHFPWNIWKLIMFDPSMTVEEAINVITSKREDNEEAGGEGKLSLVFA